VWHGYKGLEGKKLSLTLSMLSSPPAAAAAAAAASSSSAAPHSHPQSNSYAHLNSNLHAHTSALFSLTLSGSSSNNSSRNSSFSFSTDDFDDHDGRSFIVADSELERMILEDSENRFITKIIRKHERVRILMKMRANIDKEFH
jgi:hypothetical protein